MTDNNHLITPPPELVQQWAKQMITPDDGNLALDFDWFATQAARWGADQELDACCEWLNREVGTGWGHGTKLRAARRPKPPSLKEQALQALDCLCVNHTKATAHENTIRRALESLLD